MTKERKNNVQRTADCCYYPAKINLDKKMLAKYPDPKNDFAFKKIFGTEKNKDILIHFLNDMITFKEKSPIVSVKFLKTIQDPDIAVMKTSLVDILCMDEKGNCYIVEMLVAKEKGFEKKAHYYAFKAYTSQATEGGYQDLKGIIYFAIADFVMFPQKTAYKSDHVILDKESLENDLKDFSFTFLELPKFTKNIDHLSNMTEKWTYFFKHAESASEEEISKLIGNDEIIERAYEELNRIAWNDVELLTYNQAEKYEGTYRASMAQKYDEGKVEGKVEGKIEEKMSIACKMIENKFDLSMISLMTGLSLEQIKNISKETQY